MNKLLAKAVAFVKTHGVELATTYASSVATLVISHTAPFTSSAVLSIFSAAALATAKQANASPLVQGLLGRFLGGRAAGK